MRRLHYGTVALAAIAVIAAGLYLHQSRTIQAKAPIAPAVLAAAPAPPRPASPPASTPSPAPPPAADTGEGAPAAPREWADMGEYFNSMADDYCACPDAECRDWVHARYKNKEADLPHPSDRTALDAALKRYRDCRMQALNGPDR